MEEKKIIKLNDEMLNEAAGGWGEGTVVVTCTCCQQGQIGIPPSGPWAELCPHCGAVITCSDGRIQFCIPQLQQPDESYDQDDSWL